MNSDMMVAERSRSRCGDDAACLSAEDFGLSLSIGIFCKIVSDKCMDFME